MDGLGLVGSRIRRVIADQLGVGVTDLTAEVSLRDDLALDSLDLLELALALEATLGIRVPERALDDIRSYGDLAETTLALVRRRLEVEASAAEEPAFVWARVTPPERSRGGTVERAGWLTPYATETIAAAARRAGQGARLELTTAADTPEGVMARVEEQFAWLRNRGVQVDIRREQQPEAPPHPHAA